MLGGVCAALARAYGLDATLVRAAFALLGLLGVGLLAYLLCWGLLPREDAI
jgi:phage shock protein PspC (stress-responsive transcriptional regulator)